MCSQNMYIHFRCIAKEWCVALNMQLHVMWATSAIELCVCKWVCVCVCVWLNEWICKLCASIYLQDMFVSISKYTTDIKIHWIFLYSGYYGCFLGLSLSFLSSSLFFLSLFHSFSIWQAFVNDMGFVTSTRHPFDNIPFNFPLLSSAHLMENATLLELQLQLHFACTSAVLVFFLLFFLNLTECLFTSRCFCKSSFQYFRLRVQHFSRVISLLLKAISDASVNTIKELGKRKNDTSSDRYISLYIYILHNWTNKHLRSILRLYIFQLEHWLKCCRFFA